MQRLLLLLLLPGSCYLNAQENVLWLLPKGDYVKGNTMIIAAKSLGVEAVFLDKYQAEILKDSIPKHNTAVWKQLETLGIEEAKMKFSEAYDKEYEKVQQAVNISLNHEYVSDIYDKLKRQKRQQKTVIQKMTDTEYRFMIYSLDKNSRQKTELRFIVSTKDNSVRMFK